MNLFPPEGFIHLFSVFQLTTNCNSSSKSFPGHESPDLFLLHPWRVVWWVKPALYVRPVLFSTQITSLPSLLSSLWLIRGRACSITYPFPFPLQLSYLLSIKKKTIQDSPIKSTYIWSLSYLLCEYPYIWHLSLNGCSLWPLWKHWVFFSQCSAPFPPLR